ncbi:MAG: Gfo/Idh/MocA family oxidoreductase [Acholeplasmataceae bacterium]|nr:Gfo/Idh/MocA family oxidoreductase [Acholeplasmataceae bacterium]
MSLRFGVIGAGRIAHTFSKAITSSLCEEAIPYAIASRDITKAEVFKTTYGYQKAYGSYEDMLEDDQVDIVYVATPHGLHYAHMRLALNANKHILCEKAFTLNAHQAKVILDLANAKGLFVMEAMWTRFLPLINDIRKMISEGLIGSITGMDVTFGFNSDAPDSDRLFNMALGGGAILDITIYPLTMADIFLGKPETITSAVEKHQTGADITNHITLGYPDDVKVMIHTSFKDDLSNTCVITGTRKTITMPNFWGGQHAIITDASGHMETIDRPFVENGFEYQIDHVTKMIKSRQKASPIMPHQKTLEMLELMDSIRAKHNIVYPNEST